LFHFSPLSEDKPHELARAAFQLAEKINPKIDLKLVGQVYLHYGHLEWAAETFQSALQSHLQQQMHKESITLDVEVLLLLAEIKDTLGSPCSIFVIR